MADKVLVGRQRQLVDAVIRVDDVQLLARLSRQIRGLRVAPVSVCECGRKTYAYLVSRSLRAEHLPAV